MQKGRTVSAPDEGEQRSCTDDEALELSSSGPAKPGYEGHRGGIRCLLWMAKDPDSFEAKAFALMLQVWY